MSGSLCVVLGGGGPAFKVTVAPPLVSGSGDTPSIRTGAATATVEGGVGPFSYSWSLISADPNVTLNLETPTRAFFLAIGMLPNEEANGTAICSVTDTATGLTEVSNELTGLMFRTGV